MRTSSLRMLYRGIILAASGISAFGATYTFNFNTLTGYSNTAGNQAASIASQLQTQLKTVCPACTVTATTGTVGVIDKAYTGEGFAVGPTSGSNVVSETLGDTPNNTAVTSNSQYSYSQLTTNGFNTQFLANTNDSSTQLGSEISFQFSGLTITGASFNYEIFPSATPGGFTFEAGKNTSGTDTTIFTGAGVTPSSGSADGSSTHSPKSGTGSNETNTQYIGSWSDISGGSGPLSATELDFVDWPVTIGVSDLTIAFTTPPSVPEPSSVILFATVALGAFLIARRQPRKA